MSFGARALIRLGALTHNFNVIRSCAPQASIMAVVKANAYGHGLTVVARALPEVDSLAVARLPEAEELRAANIRKPIVLLSGVYSPEELSNACKAGCELVVHNDEQVRLLESMPEQRAIVWLKIDTGMNRLGFPPSQAAALIDRLRSCQAVASLRLMTHLANADDKDDPKTALQLGAFEAVASDFDGHISIANSGGIFGWPEAIAPGYLSAGASMWIRPGIALYGVSPFPECNGADLGLQPVMQFESRLIAVKRINAGEKVGYGGHWTAERNSKLGIVSVGYGDGYTRSLPSGTPVLINDRIAPVIGRVSMDMTAVDLGPESIDQVGDAVLLWGDDLPVESIARQAGLIAYPLVCGVMNREASTVVR